MASSPSKIERTEEKAVSYLILDTCIIEYFTNEEMAQQVIREITEAAGIEYSLGISEFTIFECLHTAPIEIEQNRLEALQQFSTFPVDNSVLLVAARLGSLYKQEELGKKEKIDHGDKIIAASAINSQSLICTANPKDFPYPFFKSVLIREVGYIQAGKEYSVLIHYLMPQMDKILEAFNRRNAQGDNDT